MQGACYARAFLGAVAAANAGIAGVCWLRHRDDSADVERPKGSRVQVTSVYRMNGRVRELFPSICNPRMLNQSTPMWFRLFLKEDVETVGANGAARRRGFADVDAFFKTVDELPANAACDGDVALDTETPVGLELNYWNVVGCFVFPWTSRVLEMRLGPDEVCGGCPSVHMHYAQKYGPYHSFDHTYHITQCPNEPGHEPSMVVRDVITADMGFHGYPRVNRAANAVTGYLLGLLLNSRCRYFLDQRGGEAVQLRTEYI